MNLDRRQFFGLGIAASMFAMSESTGYAEAPMTVSNANCWHGLKIGVASYTFREFSLTDCIKGIQRVDLKYVSVKDVHLPMKSTPEERRIVRQQFLDAGITPLSCGVVYFPTDEPGMRNAFEYAKDLGVPTIVCSFDPSSIDTLNGLVKEYDIRLAIHNHGPGDKRFPRPSDVMELVKGYDKRIGLCIDVGHTLRAGEDPADDVLKYRDRLYDMHLKDETKSAPDGQTVEAGRGVMNLKEIFQALLQIKYSHLASFEYEKDGSDPLPGLAESVGYCKGLLRGMTNS